MRRYAALVALAALASCATESDPVGIDIEFDSGLPRSIQDNAQRVAIYLVDSCDDVALGAAPASFLASTMVMRDQEDVSFDGFIPPDDFGLYAFAQDADCAVTAAACVPVSSTDGVLEPLQITLLGFSGAGCDVDEQCSVETGACVPEGGTGGMGGTAGVGGMGGMGGVGGQPPVDCSVEADETPCSVLGTPGMCRAGSCCTGCWNGSACEAGDISTSCGAAGDVCQFCNCFSDECVEGACKPTPTFTQIDLGEEHSCGLDDTGRIWCWGTHQRGELGVGRRRTRYMLEQSLCALATGDRRVPWDHRWGSHVECCVGGPRCDVRNPIGG